jgi:hypothetical protein
VLRGLHSTHPAELRAQKTSVTAIKIQSATLTGQRPRRKLRGFPSPKSQISGVRLARSGASRTALGSPSWAMGARTRCTVIKARRLIIRRFFEDIALVREREYVLTRCIPCRSPSQSRARAERIQIAGRHVYSLAIFWRAERRIRRISLNDRQNPRAGHSSRGACGTREPRLGGRRIA